MGQPKTYLVGTTAHFWTGNDTAAVNRQKWAACPFTGSDSPKRPPAQLRLVRLGEPGKGNPLLLNYTKKTTKDAPTGCTCRKYPLMGFAPIRCVYRSIEQFRNEPWRLCLSTAEANYYASFHKARFHAVAWYFPHFRGHARRSGHTKKVLNTSLVIGYSNLLTD